MLQADAAAGGNAGKLGVFNDRLSVELDREAVAFHCDEEAVPLARPVVGADFWRGGGADIRRLLRVGAVAPYLPAAGGPAPDVYLSLVRAAQVDATVAGVGDFLLLRLAIGVLGFFAGRQDDRVLHLHRVAREPPV